MGIRVRASSDRGQFDFGWLKTSHTFSFGEYYDPQYMGFRSLRVINEDYIQAGKGFPTHAHRDMEIISYVVSGALAHKDSMGNGSAILPGDVQFMSAGSGVTHSEYNHAVDGETHLIQIWILPQHQNRVPRYDQKQFSRDEKINQFCQVVAGLESKGKKNDKAILIDQDALLFVSIIEKGTELQYQLDQGRGAYVQIISGELLLNDQLLRAGDGAFIEEVSQLGLVGQSAESEFLLFDLAD